MQSLSFSFKQHQFFFVFFWIPIIPQDVGNFLLNDIVSVAQSLHKDVLLVSDRVTREITDVHVSSSFQGQPLGDGSTVVCGALHCSHVIR